MLIQGLKFIKLRNGNQGVSFKTDERPTLHRPMDLDDGEHSLNVTPFWTKEEHEDYYIVIANINAETPF